MKWFDFHYFRLSVGFNRAFRGLVVCEIVWIDDTSETFDKIKVFITLFCTAGDNYVNEVNRLSFGYNFFSFLVNLLGWLHPYFYDLVSSQVIEKGAVCENFIEANLLKFKLGEMDVDQSSVNFFSQIFELSIVYKTLLMKVLKFDFFMF